MRIAIDARFLGPAGTGLGKYTEKLLKNLEKLDSKNQYFILLKKDNFGAFNPKTENFTKVLADIHWYGVSEQVKIPKILAKIKPDLVHFCHFNVPVLYRGKFVVTIHDLIKHEFAGAASTTKAASTYFLKHASYKLVISKAIKKSEKIFVPSNWVKKRILIEYKIPKEKIIVTYEAADDEFSGEIKIDKAKILERYKIKPPFLIYVGNLYPYKNLELVLKALKILEKDPLGLQLKLLIASSRDVFHQRFSQLVRSYKLEDRVVMPGFVPPEDLVTLFKEAEAFVFPSLSEGFGIPGLDAMSAGLPVLASNIPVFHEVYGDAVLYFSPKNPADLADKIKLIIADNKFKQDLIKKGKQQTAKYSWQKMAKETLKVYQQVS